MKMSTKIWCLVTFVLLLAGCASTKEAEVLTRQTSSAIVEFNKSLAAFAKAVQRRQKLTAQEIVVIETRASNLADSLDRWEDVIELGVNDPQEKKRLEFYRKMQGYMADLTARELAKALTDEERANRIVRELASYKPPSDELKEVSKKLADLMKRGSKKERLKTLADYLSTVASEVKEAQEAAEKAQQGAN